MKNLITFFLAAILIFFTPVFSDPQIGQSSIVTLAFPWGARAAALGETFTGIADDEEALFYNPAGLGLSPLAKTWIHYQPCGEQKIVAVASGTKTQKDVWVLSEQNEIYKFNGVDWVNYLTHTIDSSDNFSSIAEKYYSFESSEELSESALELKRFNGVYAKERKKISAILSRNLSKDQADSLSRFFTFLQYSEQSKNGIKGYLMEYFDNDEADATADEIIGVLDKISGLSGIYDLKIPYTIALKGKLNDIICDAVGRLWVAGDDGLWRFDNEWKKFTNFDGVPEAKFNSLTELANGDVAIATSVGGYLFENGLFSKITGEAEIFDGEVLFVNKINNDVYLGTENGLLLVSNGKENLIDTAKGLVNNVVRTIAIDQKKRIWVGGDEGVSLWTGFEWKKFRFKNSKVFDIVIEKDNKIWFATNNGAVEYYEGKDGLPEWKVHHEKNNLPSSVINSAVFHRNDIWLATDKGISRFQHGEVRATMYFENLLPSLHISDMWHAAVAGVIPLGEWGTIGVFFNQLYFGDIETNNPDGSLGAVYSAFEIVSGIGYGMRLKKDFAAGINLKHFYSRLKKDEAEAQSFAIDAGIIKNNFLTKDLSLGFSILNMGPSVAYTEDDAKMAIPFTLRLGASYKPIKKATNYLLLALDLEREIVYRDENDGTPAPFFKAFYKDLFDDERESARDELKKITIHTGLEFNYLDFISPRIGWMYDKAGFRNEIDIGIGLNINVISADFGMIFALGDNDVRQSQIRFSITYAR
ncbi:MAG: PorV/PorQ family protein [Chitinispirillales bacterium]|jgi:hypothetical protein|nr:PorV/PorQ family protein [Chitinispirillales bacterium]